MEKIHKVEDQDKLLAQNSIKYLDSLTKIKELNAPTLKSLYRTKCKLMELRRHIFLPKEKPNYRCQRCFMNFSEGPTKHEIRPVKLSDFDKKVLRKVRNTRPLTTFQRTYYKKLIKKFPNGFQEQNKMVITCDFCKKESEIWMTKPKKTYIPTKKVVTPGKKKKKSKKDKFCGLNENAVLQSTSTKKNPRKNQRNLDKTKNTLNVSTNGYITTDNSNNNHLNASVSMTNTRSFDTADFIPLEMGKRKEKIKFSRENKNNNVSKLQTISKSKEKLQQKNLKTLGNILKKANENKNKQSSNLKNFLAGL